VSREPLDIARHLIVQTLGAGISHRIEPDAMLIDDLGADSLDLIELQCAIEDLANEAPDDAFHRGIRVRDVAALIKFVGLGRPVALEVGDIVTRTGDDRYRVIALYDGADEVVVENRADPEDKFDILQQDVEFVERSA